MADAKLVTQVGELAAVRFEGEALRHVAAAYDPLSGRGARIQGGRWNPAGSFAVLYLGLDRQTVIDEFHRLAQRQRRDPGDFLPRTLYRYDLVLQRLADLRDPASTDALGLDPADLRSDRLDACQRVGQAAFDAGREGLLAPSAAGAGTVLALFVDRIEPPSRIAPTRLETWEDPP